MIRSADHRPDFGSRRRGAADYETVVRRAIAFKMDARERPSGLYNGHFTAPQPSSTIPFSTGVGYQRERERNPTPDCPLIATRPTPARRLARGTALAQLLPAPPSRATVRQPCGSRSKLSPSKERASGWSTSPPPSRSGWCLRHHVTIRGNRRRSFNFFSGRPAAPHPPGLQIQ